MPTLTEILKKIRLPANNKESDDWKHNFEAQFKITIGNELEWPESEEPGTADDFVKELEARLTDHPKRTDIEYRLSVLREFYHYFDSRKGLTFNNSVHEQQFLGKNGLRGAIGRTIESKYLRPVILQAAREGLDGIQALGQFPREPLVTMIHEEKDLLMSIFEAPEPDDRGHTTLSKNLSTANVNHFLGPIDVPSEIVILLTNYIRCLAGVAPFQTVSPEVWDRSFLCGIAVIGDIGRPVKVTSVRFIPRLEPPDEPVYAPQEILSHAREARKQALKFLEVYDEELHRTISPCQIHIQVAGLDTAGPIEGNSIILFLVLIILMQATGVVHQVIDDVMIIVTGNLLDNGIIKDVNEVNAKIRAALDEATISKKEKRLLMFVPEENRKDALKGLETWSRTPVLAILHGGEPQTGLDGTVPSVEIVSYHDLSQLLLSRCLVDLPRVVELVSNGKHKGWNEKTRDRFFQILMDTASAPIKYEQGSSANLRGLQEALIDEWLSRQPIFLNEKDRDAALKIKKSFSKVERLIKAQEFEEALKVLNESVSSLDSLNFFWKKKAEKLEQEVAEAEKLKQQKKAIQDQLNLQRELKELQQQQIKAEQNRLSLQQEVEEVHNQREKLQNRLVKQGWWIIIISILITGLILILGTPLFLSYFRFGAPSELTVKTDELKILKAGAFAFLTVEVENPSALTLEYEWGVEYGKVKFSPDSPFAEYTAPSTIVEDDGILQDTAILKVKNNGKTIFISNPIQIFVSAP
jgi:hypothetical protein